MEHTIQNSALKLTATEQGGLLWGIQKSDGQELLWGGDPDIWGFRAPVCFPWCGVIQDNWFEAEGQKHEVTTRHGFVRDFPHKLVAQTADSLTFRFDHHGGEPWPWAFTFETVHKIEGTRAYTICTAQNTGDKAMPTQMGYHPAFRVPFVAGSQITDYVLKFESGVEIPLEEHMFDADSFNRKDGGAWCRLEHKDSGKCIQVTTAGYFTTVLWSKPGIPGFLCIEPWDGHVNDSHDLSKRPGAIWLQPGEKKTWTLEMDFRL